MFCNLEFMFSLGRESSLSSARFRILNIYAFSSSPAHFPHRFSARFSSFARSFDGLRNEPNGGSLLARLPLTAAAVLHFHDCVRVHRHTDGLRSPLRIRHHQGEEGLRSENRSQVIGLPHKSSKMPISQEEENGFIDEE